MAYDYILADVRPLIAQWDKALSDSDLSECAPETGAFYKKALAELTEALYNAGYNPRPGPVEEGGTPIAWQICHDTLTSGICLYFVESHTAVAYQEGVTNLQSAFYRYRQRLQNIKNKGQLGEFGQSHKRYCKVSQKKVIDNFVRVW
jgi:hypothetical protein